MPNKSTSFRPFVSLLVVSTTIIVVWRSSGLGSMVLEIEEYFSSKVKTWSSTLLISNDYRSYFSYRFS